MRISIIEPSLAIAVTEASEALLGGEHVAAAQRAYAVVGLGVIGSEHQPRKLRCHLATFGQ
jgi:hypothetical protein